MFLEYRCPNVIEKNGTKYPCRAILGGPEVESFESYNFIKAFKDIRFCPKCHTFFEVTLISNKLLPTYRVIKKDEKIDFTQPFIDNRVE